MAARLLYASFWAGFPVPNLPSPDPRTRELVSGRDSRGLRQRPRSGEAGRTRSPLTLHPPRRRRGRGKRRAPGRDLIHTDAGPGTLAGPGPARLAQLVTTYLFNSIHLSPPLLRLLQQPLPYQADRGAPSSVFPFSCMNFSYNNPVMVLKFS